MQRVLVTGATGLVGSACVRAARREGFAVAATWHVQRPEPLDGVVWEALDLGDPSSLRRLVGSLDVDAVIHAAALVVPARAEDDPAAARRLNTDASAVLARACADRKVRMIQVSTDLVFDGHAGPYAEADRPTATSVYGQTKADAEDAVLSASAGNVVVRTGLVLGPSPRGDRGVEEVQAAALHRGESPRLFVDEVRTPVCAEDLAATLVALCRVPVTGLLHVAGPDALSRFELGVVIAAALGQDPRRLMPVRIVEVPGLRPPRAPQTALRTDLLRSLALLPHPRPVAVGLRSHPLAVSLG